jgi:predicted dehydrogenase
MALKVKDAEELVSIARAESLILMVGHIYLYHPVVEQIKKYLAEFRPEDIYYLHSVRTGLGPIRADTNALWDLAPHDISMFLHLLDRMPMNVSARGASFLQKGIEDVVSLSMEFPGKSMGYIHVSWLDPYKLRRLTIVGKDRMILFDDTSSDEKLRILNQGFLKKNTSTYGEFILEARRGDIHVPRIEPGEPLRTQCANFIECIRTGARPLADGEQGLKTVRILEAAQRSLNSMGSSMNISK